MTKLEIAFQSVKVAIGIFVAFLVFGYVHPATKLGAGVYGTPAFNDYLDSTSATTTLANYPGILHTISVTVPAANSIISVYDSATTTIVTSTVLVASIKIPATVSSTPFTLTFDNIFTQGLTVLQSGASSTLTAEFQQN